MFCLMLVHYFYPKTTFCVHTIPKIQLIFFFHYVFKLIQILFKVWITHFVSPASYMYCSSYFCICLADYDDWNVHTNVCNILISIGFYVIDCISLDLITDIFY